MKHNQWTSSLRLPALPVKPRWPHLMKAGVSNRQTLVEYTSVTEVLMDRVCGRKVSEVSRGGKHSWCWWNDPWTCWERREVTLYISFTVWSASSAHVVITCQQINKCFHYRLLLIILKNSDTRSVSCEIIYCTLTLTLKIQNGEKSNLPFCFLSHTHISIFSLFVLEISQWCQQCTLNPAPAFL